MKHLTEGQRYEISALLKAHHKLNEIAILLGVHKSTVTRELQRNGYLGYSGRKWYYAGHAQRKSEQRWATREVPERFTADLKNEVRRLLVEEDLSPEQISGRLKLEGKRTVSHETIYKWIWRDKRRGGTLYKHLRHHGMKYARRGNINNSRSLIPNRIEINERPRIVDRRTRFGDFEIDTIIGKVGQHILTVVDRKTGLLRMEKLADASAASGRDSLIHILDPFVKMGLAHTVTGDNGIQFAEHEAVSRALNGCVRFYFAHPYHACERGTNENTNGLIRQYLPKGTDFNTVSEEQVLAIQDKINNRPRKRLGFFSPNELFNSLTKTTKKVAFDG